LENSREFSQDNSIKHKNILNLDHLSLVFIGHVDSGKSTLAGQIMLKTNKIPERQLKKYIEIAKANKMESWLYAYFVDNDPHEQKTGKTVECGKVCFNTNKKRYTIMDAPGHGNYIPNMIYGSYQADISLLIISARNNEFETGFNKGGQTREHANISYTIGHKKIICVINKMDTIKWDQKRYQMISNQITKFLHKRIGFKTKNIHIIPVDSFNGININEKVSNNICGWYDGKCLLDALDGIKKIKRHYTKALRMAVMYSCSIITNNNQEIKNKIGINGKIQNGVLKVGDNVVIMPINKSFKVSGIKMDNVEVNESKAGDIVFISIDIGNQRHISKKSIKRGCVICHKNNENNVIPVTKYFQAQIFVKDVPDCGLITKGFKCILHCHNIEVNCELDKIRDINKNGVIGKQMFLRKEMSGMVIIKTNELIAVETYNNCDLFARFILRDKDKTIAIGKIEKIKPFLLN